MAIFRKIKISFWQDRYILKLPPLEKYFYLYLLTNSQTKQCGIYEIPVEVMKMETGLEEKEIYNHIDKFQKDGKIKFNKENSEIMIRNWLKHNHSRSMKIIKCAKEEIKNVKTKSFIEHYYTLCIEYGCSIDTVSKEEEEEEKEKEKEKENPEYEESDSQYHKSDIKEVLKAKELKPKKHEHDALKKHARNCFKEQGPDCRFKRNSRGLEEKCYICLAERKNWKKEITSEIK